MNSGTDLRCYAARFDSFCLCQQGDKVKSFLHQDPHRKRTNVNGVQERHREWERTKEIERTRLHFSHDILAPRMDFSLYRPCFFPFADPISIGYLRRPPSFCSSSFCRYYGGHEHIADHCEHFSHNFSFSLSHIRLPPPCTCIPHFFQKLAKILLLVCQTPLSTFQRIPSCFRGLLLCILVLLCNLLNTFIRRGHSGRQTERERKRIGKVRKKPTGLPRAWGR